MLISPVSTTFQSFAALGHDRQEPHVIHGEEENEHNKVEQPAEGSLQRKETSHSNEEEPKQKQNEEVRKLAARDREVRAHEAAHKAAGGSLTGPASFSFTNGPDGKRYANSGEVSIDTSEVAGDAQATLIKANQIRAAALAPAQPSNADQAVAAKAAQMAAEARVKILAEQNTEATSKDTNKVKEDSINATHPKNEITAYQTSSTNPPQVTIDILA